MRVFVYYTLHKKLWSVKALEGPQKGRVIRRANHVTLRDAMPKVSQKGRERVLREKRKNVHAGIVGTLCSPQARVPITQDSRISYNPYKSGSFYYTKDPSRVYTGSDYVKLITNLDHKPFVFTHSTGAHIDE